MKIRCPQCATLYDVAEEIVLAGSDLQCAVCATIFPAEPFNDEPPAAGAAPAEEASSAEADGFDDAADLLTPAPGADVLDDIEDAAVADLVPEADAAGEDWEAEIGRWAEGFGADDGAVAAEGTPDDTAAPAADAEPAGDLSEELASLLTEEERALFGALLGTGAAGEEAPEPEVSPVPEPFASADTYAPGDLDWADPDDVPADRDEQPVPLDEIEVKEPLLPPDAEAEAEVEADDDDTAADEAELEVAASRVPLWLGWAALGLFLGVVASAGLVLRVQIAALVPGMADLYAAAGLPVNVRGLEFQHLDHHWQQADGRLRLVVRGEIVNVTARTRPLPEIVFAMRDERGMEFFQWLERIDAQTLPAGARARFRAQIPAPPDRARQVHIRFAK